MCSHVFGVGKSGEKENIIIINIIGLRRHGKPKSSPIDTKIGLQYF